MITTDKYQEFLDLTKSIGQSAMHYMYPNDFEVYMCSLELVDSDDKTVEMFVFPVMPQQMQEREQAIVNIKKTSGGVTVLSTPAFIPTEITIRGNFGKQFKIMIGNKEVDTSVISFSTVGDNYINYPGELNIKHKSFSKFLKTGYGAFKILEAIIFKSRALDRKGNPFRLYFYNPALGNSYMVKIVDFTARQAMDTNMIWNYDLNMKSIAPITVRSLANNKSSLTRLLVYDNLNKITNQALFNVKQTLQNINTNPSNWGYNLKPLHIP